MVHGMKDFRVMIQKTEETTNIVRRKEIKITKTMEIPATLLIDPMGPIPPKVGTLKIRAGVTIKKNVSYYPRYLSTVCRDDTKVISFTLLGASKNGGKCHEQVLEIKLIC